VPPLRRPSTRGDAYGEWAVNATPIEFVMHDGLDECCQHALRFLLPRQTKKTKKLACFQCGQKLKLVEGVWYQQELAP
jgi:hypothetical protein